MTTLTGGHSPASDGSRAVDARCNSPIGVPANTESIVYVADTYRRWHYALTVALSAKESFYKAVAVTVGQFFDFCALRIEE